MKRLESPVGLFAVPAIAEVKDASSIPSIISTLFQVLRGVVTKLNGGLSLGNGTTYAGAGNLDAVYVDLLAPAAANTQLAIPHSLGRTPIGYLPVRKDRACDVYDSSAGSWTADIMYLKFTVASATIKLLIW